jgi:hypothetical protein
VDRQATPAEGAAAADWGEGKSVAQERTLTDQPPARIILWAVQQPAPWPLHLHFLSQAVEVSCVAFSGIVELSSPLLPEEGGATVHH